MISRVEIALDRELDNRHVSLRKHQPQGSPCSVVKTTHRIDIAGQTCRFEEIDYLPGEIRTPRCRIGDIVYQSGGNP